MSRKNILTHSVPLFLRSSVLCCGREQSLWNLSFKEHPSFSIQPSGLGIKSWKAGSSTPARTGAEHEPKSRRRAGQGPTRLSGHFDQDGRYLQKFRPRCLAAARTRWPKRSLPSPLPAPRTHSPAAPGLARALGEQTRRQQLRVAEVLFCREVTCQALGRTYPVFGESWSRLLREGGKGGFAAIFCPRKKKRGVEATASPAIPPAARAEFQQLTITFWHTFVGLDLTPRKGWTQPIHGGICAALLHEEVGGNPSATPQRVCCSRYSPRTPFLVGCTRSAAARSLPGE